MSNDLISTATAVSHRLFKRLQHHDRQDSIQQIAYHALRYPMLNARDANKGLLNACYFGAKEWWKSFKKTYLRGTVTSNTLDSRVAPSPPEPTERFESLIGHLEPLHKVILRSRFVSGQTYREIATKLGIPKSTVQKRYREAVRALTPTPLAA